MCILINFLNVIKRVYIGKVKIKRNVNKNILCTEMHCNVQNYDPIDVLWKQNVCYLLDLKPSENVT